MPLFTAIVKAIAADDHDDVNDVLQTAYSRGYCAAKQPLAIKFLTLRALTNPLRQSTRGVGMMVDHAPMLLGADAATMVELADSFLATYKSALRR